MDYNDSQRRTDANPGFITTFASAKLDIRGPALDGTFGPVRIAPSGCTMMLMQSRPLNRAWRRYTDTGKYLLVLFLALHGLVHGLGFAATWKIGAPVAVSATPSLIPGLAPGGPAVQVLGVLWLVALIAFATAAFGLLTNRTWWRTAAATAAVVSLALCVAWWSDAKAGVVIDIGILVLIAVSALPRRHAAVGGAS
jgi:hypothetical protein